MFVGDASLQSKLDDDVFYEVSEAEYKNVVAERLAGEDFIVDDDGSVGTLTMAWTIGTGRRDPETRAMVRT